MQITNQELEVAMDDWFNQNMFSTTPIGQFICNRFDLCDQELRVTNNIGDALDIIGTKYLIQ